MLCIACDMRCAQCFTVFYGWSPSKQAQASKQEKKDQSATSQSICDAAVSWCRSNSKQQQLQQQQDALPEAKQGQGNQAGGASKPRQSAGWQRRQRGRGGGGGGSGGRQARQDVGRCRWRGCGDAGAEGGAETDAQVTDADFGGRRRGRRESLRSGVEWEDQLQELCCSHTGRLQRCAATPSPGWQV